MARLTLLGTGSAWSGPERENTFMVVEGDKTRILVDCGGGPAQRLAAAGVAISSIDHVILTHTHPDHIYGWPVFALDAWMAGRRDPVHVYGLRETLRASRLILKAVQSNQWPDFFPLRYHLVDPEGSSLILADEEFSVSAALTEHFVPTIALRFTCLATGVSVAYSCDTAPSGQIVEMARGVKYLFHEATTLEVSAPGHTSAVQAGVQAKRAKALALVLLHLPPDVRPTKWRAAARREFDGPVIVARDMQSFSF
jgi:ribonuclease Z